MIVRTLSTTLLTSISKYLEILNDFWEIARNPLKG